MSLKSNYLSQFLSDVRQAMQGDYSEDVAIAQELGPDLVQAQSYQFDLGSAEVLAGLLKETKGDLDKLPWPRLPFERMFLELPNVDPVGGKHIKTIGVLISPAGEDRSSVVVLGKKQNEELARPMVRVIFDKEGDYEIAYLSGGEELARDFRARSGLGEDMALAIAAKNAIEIYLTAGIFAELHNREGMFQTRKESTVTRQQRRQAERQGQRLPDRTVTHISLDELGRRHLEAVRGERAGPGEGQGTKRAHWVRGHMFLARNGVLTWRKPHVRGIGPVLPKERIIVAPEASEDEEPGFSP